MFLRTPKFAGAASIRELRVVWVEALIAVLGSLLLVLLLLHAGFSAAGLSLAVLLGWSLLIYASAVGYALGDPARAPVADILRDKARLEMAPAVGRVARSRPARAGLAMIAVLIAVGVVIANESERPAVAALPFQQIPAGPVRRDPARLVPPTASPTPSNSTAAPSASNVPSSPPASSSGPTRSPAPSPGRSATPGPAASGSPAAPTPWRTASPAPSGPGNTPRSPSRSRAAGRHRSRPFFLPDSLPGPSAGPARGAARAGVQSRQPRFAHNALGQEARVRHQIELRRPGSSLVADPRNAAVSWIQLQVMARARTPLAISYRVTAVVALNALLEAGSGS